MNVKCKEKLSTNSRTKNRIFLGDVTSVQISEPEKLVDDSVPGRITYKTSYKATFKKVNFDVDVFSFFEVPTTAEPLSPHALLEKACKSHLFY